MSETAGGGVASKELFVESSKVCDNERARADLNGVREVADVRNLLREWMASTGEPTGDDVETVETFLGDLVDEDDLEAVLWLIRGAIQCCCEIQISSREIFQ